MHSTDIATPTSDASTGIYMGNIQGRVSEKESCLESSIPGLAVVVTSCVGVVTSCGGVVGAEQTTTRGQGLGGGGAAQGVARS